eukprot:scaffold74386_cov84-Phaeocystis_antarctica.AAC.2
MRVHKRQRGGAWGPQRFLAAAGRGGARRARPQCLMTSLQTCCRPTRCRHAAAAPRRAGQWRRGRGGDCSAHRRRG